MVATSWAANNLKPGDAVLLTEMEHHANLVPWLMLAEQKGIELRWIDIDDDYRLDLSDLDRLLDGVKLVACTVDVERPRDDPPDGGDRRSCPRGRCARGGRRGPGGPSPAGRRDDARL